MMRGPLSRSFFTEVQNMMRGPLSRSFFIILQVSLWNLFEVKTMLPKFCLRISINHRTMH